MEVGASPPDADVLIYPRPTPASPSHTSHNSPTPGTDACGPPRPILTRPLLPPDQGCREILSTSGPFTVLAPLVSSRTMNVSPRLLPGPAAGLQSVPTTHALWGPSPGRPPVPTLLGRSGTKRTARPGPTRHPRPCARRHPSPSSCADSTSSPASTCLRRQGARLHAGGGRWPGRRSLLVSAASG